MGYRKWSRTLKLYNMKRLLLILLLFIGVNSFAQIGFAEKEVFVSDTSIWLPVDTLYAVQGNIDSIDTIMYTFNGIPSSLPFNRYNEDYYVPNDTVYWKLTKRLKIDVYRSRKILVSQFTIKYIKTTIPNSSDYIVEQTLLKADSMGITNNNTYWNYVLPLITVNDSIQ